jgi:glycosyltransferase involved in cell wall biosynthesis
MRALIVADNMSMRMGGEAVLPLHYFREMTALGVDVHALTHARVRDEISALPLFDPSRFHFIDDAPLEIAIHRLSRAAPGAVRETLFLNAIGVSTGLRLARRARTLATEIRADIIHQPTPVSPAAPSYMTAMPAPLVIGPMNGGMDYPPTFARDYARGSAAIVSAGRAASGAANRAFPGKRDAAVLLVANARTRDALPSAIDRDRVRLLVENGVDLDLWRPADAIEPAPPTFVFVGRLVWWKAVELLIDAFAGIGGEARLIIIGDGEERAMLEARASASGAGARISFEGFRSQREIAAALSRATALVLPSLRECGGAVVLEAFACGAPAIATDWGGPADYITPQSGVLVPPRDRAAFIGGLRDAMAMLAADPARARAMGAAGRALVEAHYSWRAKARAMLDIYREAAGGVIPPTDL